MKLSIQTLITTLGITLLSTMSLQAGNPNPGIVPPHAVYKGKTAGEWTIAWWQWVLGTEGEVQMYDTTGEYAHVNNNGEEGVFFLAKSWTEKPEERHIEIPAGTPLYVPLMGGGWIGGYPGRLLERYESVENLYETSIYPDILGVHDLSLVIDGVPAAGLEDGNPYSLNFIEDGDDLIVPLWFADGTEGELAGYEFSLIVTPLTPGEHVLEMKGTWSDESYSFVSDVTYYITVLPGNGKD